MGIQGFTTTNWSSATTNCNDRSTKLNAWGMGLPQQELERLKADPAVVALAVQEAWGCGSPENVNSIVGFKTASRQENGVALLARYGFAQPPTYRQIDRANARWLVGGHVCLDSACAHTLPVFTTHLGGRSDGDFPGQAEALVDALRDQTQAHLFLGDLNLFRVDQWNPRVPCTAADSNGRLRALEIFHHAGYQDAWAKTQAGEGWTGMSSRKGCGSPEGNLYKRIDYVFARRLQVVSTARFAQVKPGADAPSDHAGLIAEFSVPEQ
jgi:endonuclease/exonuclease/phosphatase family metal-dependent hydrolase